MLIIRWEQQRTAEKPWHAYRLVIDPAGNTIETERPDATGANRWIATGDGAILSIGQILKRTVAHLLADPSGFKALATEGTELPPGGVALFGAYSDTTRIHIDLGRVTP